MSTAAPTPSEVTARRLLREHAVLAFSAGDQLQRQYERVADAARRLLLATEPDAVDRARRILQQQVDDLDEVAASYVGCAEAGLEMARQAGKRAAIRG